MPTQSQPDAVRARIQRLTNALRTAASRIVNEIPADKLSADELSQFMNQFGALQAALVDLYGKITDASGDPNNAAVDQEITSTAAPDVQSFIESVETLGPFTRVPGKTSAPTGTALAPETKKLLWFGGLLVLGGLAVWWMTRGAQD